MRFIFQDIFASIWIKMILDASNSLCFVIIMVDQFPLEKLLVGHCSEIGTLLRNNKCSE